MSVTVSRAHTYRFLPRFWAEWYFIKADRLCFHPLITSKSVLHRSTIPWGNPFTPMHTYMYVPSLVLLTELRVLHTCAWGPQTTACTCPPEKTLTCDHAVVLCSALSALLAWTHWYSAACPVITRSEQGACVCVIICKVSSYSSGNILTRQTVYRVRDTFFSFNFLWCCQ